MKRGFAARRKNGERSLHVYLVEDHWL